MSTSLNDALIELKALELLLDASLLAAAQRHNSLVYIKEHVASPVESFALQSMTKRSAEICNIFRNYSERVKEDARQIDPDAFPDPDPEQG